MANWAAALNSLGHVAGQAGTGYMKNMQMQLEEAYKQMQMQQATQELEMRKDMLSLEKQKAEMALKHSKYTMADLFGDRGQEIVGNPNVGMAGGEEYAVPQGEPTQQVDKPLNVQEIMKRITQGDVPIDLAAKAIPLLTSLQKEEPEWAVGGEGTFAYKKKSNQFEKVATGFQGKPNKLPTSPQAAVIQAEYNKNIAKGMTHDDALIDAADKAANIGGLPPMGETGVQTVAPGQRDESALAGLKPEQVQTVKGLVDYQIPLPSSFALKTPYWQSILGRARAYDPTFDATQYQVRMGVKRDFTSGKSAQAIRSLNTSVAHLETLDKQVKALDNSSFQTWNTIANWGLTKLGDPRVTNLLTTATAVEGELANVFKNTGATDQEIKAWRKNFESSNSPEQLHGAVNTVIDLLGGRLGALTNQYEMGIGKPKDFKLLSDKSRKILSGLGIDVDTLDPYHVSTKTQSTTISSEDAKAELRRRGLLK